MEPQVQYVRSADGVSIAFFEMGEGVPLILSPNIWDHLTVGWRDEGRDASLRLVRDGFRLVRYNMRGMGMSDRDVYDFSIEAQMADLEALRGRLGLERFVLYSNVHASPVCITYAARHPERLTHLILSMPFSNGNDWYRALPTLRGLESFREMGDEQWELYTLTHATALGAHTPGADAEQMAQLMRECTTPDTLRRYFEALRSQDVTPLLDEIHTPTLVVRVGGVVGSEFARSVASRIANARLVTAAASASVAGPSLEAMAHVTRFVLGREPSPLERAGAASSAAAAAGTAIILFADIVDSTALTERIGDAAFRAKARELDGALRAIIGEAGGAAIDGKLLGDGVLATFPAAAQAIEAALRCGDAGEGQGLPLHLGLHAGDVIREANNVFGGAVNIASRISALSAPGEVLVSDIVRGLARTSAGVTFEDRGEHALKGVTEPQRVFAVRRRE